MKKQQNYSYSETIVGYFFGILICLEITFVAYAVSMFVFVPVVILWIVIITGIIMNTIETKKHDPYEDDETRILTTWQDYECEVRDEFVEYGMSARTTNGSADGGIDVIVEHNGLTIGVQVKDWQNKVGIKAVGEVLMGMGSYNCDYGCVVARNGYTQPCHSSAIDNKIPLLDMEDISVYVEKIKKGRL